MNEPGTTGPLKARQDFKNAINEFLEAQANIIKFRFYKKPVESFTSKVPPGLIRLITESLRNLETASRHPGSVPANDNLPQNAIRSPQDG